MVLALRTGIPPSVWEQEDERAIVTATQLLMEAHQQAEQQAQLKPGQTVWGG